VTPSKPVETFETLPDPGVAGTVGELVECLRSLKVWAGDPALAENLVRAGHGRFASDDTILL
jgi:hypothetical protein